MITGRKGFIGSRLQDRSDVLYHCGWKWSHKPYRDEICQYDNIAQSLQHLQVAINGGVKTVIYCGSQGENNYDRYGITKRIVGDMFREICDRENLRFIWLRIYSIYGPGDHPSTLISQTIQRMFENLPIKLTESQTLWDYLYIDDLVRLMQLIPDTNVEGVMDVGSGVGKRVKDVIVELSHIIGSSSKLEFSGQDRVRQCVADTTTISKFWKPEVTIQEGLRRTVEWHRQHS